MIAAILAPGAGVASALSPPTNGNGVVQFTWGAAQSQTFSYTGATQKFVVPSGVSSIAVTAIGGAGGGAGKAKGGPGAVLTGTIGVSSGERLSIRVGGAGHNSNADTSDPNTGACAGRTNCHLGLGGFNGGGDSGWSQDGGMSGGGGGGASSVTVVLPATTLLVAAGGGGAGGPALLRGSTNAQGGAGGGAGAAGTVGGDDVNAGFAGFGGAGATTTVGGAGGHEVYGQDCTGPGYTEPCEFIYGPGGSGGMNFGSGTAGGSGGNGAGTWGYDETYGAMGGTGGGGGGGWYGGGGGGGGASADCQTPGSGCPGPLVIGGPWTDPDSAGGGGGGGGQSFVCGPTFALSAQPVIEDPASGGTLSVTAVIAAAQCPLNPAKLQLTLTPAMNFANPGQFSSFTSQQATLFKNFTLAAGQTLTVPFPGLSVKPVVVGDGFTIHGMNTWTSDGWQGTSPQKVDLTGGRLVYSDSPEYVAPTTTVISAGGKHAAGGQDVEGVLYRERSVAYATKPAGGDFRVYLNHENRTSQSKWICVVMTNPDRHSVSSVSVTKLFSGQSQNGGDPVKAGRLALVAWDDARHHQHHMTFGIGGGGGAWTDCIAKLGKGSGKSGPVVNSIMDFRANGRVQVGVVAVDSARLAAFKKDPLTFHFADQAHPHGDPARTYEHDGSLANPGEKHVNGTFAYDQADVTLTPYDLESGDPYGVLLAGDPKIESDQYEPALDTGKDNKGNYGVLYQVSVQANGSQQGEQAQVLLNPRAVGRPKGASYTNGYAGVTDVPATVTGKQIPTPDPTDPNLTKGNSNLTSNDLGVGIGTVQSGQTFSLAFMPPGGAALPVAVVLAPAFITANATLTYNQGTSKAGTVLAGPTIIPLRAG